MKITDIEAIVLRLPTVLANGDGLQDCLIIKVHASNGEYGLGEVHTSPTVAKAIIDAPISQRTVQGFRQLLVGRSPFEMNAIWDELYLSSSTYGRGGIVMNVISGIDIALWDLLGKTLQVPVSQLLGGKVRSEIKAYASDLSAPSLEEATDRALAFSDQGFRGIKFGWGALGADPDRDADRLQAVRDRIGADIDLMLDLGTGTSLQNAMRLCDRLAPIGIHFLEEPLPPDSLAEFRKLVAASRIPIATGEKETTRFRFKELIDTTGIDIIQPDVARAGGITEVRRIQAYAEMTGTRLIPHCWGTDILLSATAQFLSTVSSAEYVEVNMTNNPLRRELFVDPIYQGGGLIRLQDRPGLGLTLNEQTVEKYRAS